MISSLSADRPICSQLSICNLSFLLLSVFASPLPPSSLLSPSSKSSVWPCVSPQCAPGPAWHGLTSSLGGRWRRRRVTHLMIHLCAIGLPRQIGSQNPSTLQDEYFWPLCTVWLTLLEKDLAYLCLCECRGWKFYNELHNQIMWLCSCEFFHLQLLKATEQNWCLRWMQEVQYYPL